MFDQPQRSETCNIWDKHRALINTSHFVKNVSLRDLLSRLFVVIATHQKKTANGGHTRRAPSLTLTEKERERTILQTSGGVCIIASHLNLREREHINETVFVECFATLLVFKVGTWSRPCGVTKRNTTLCDAPDKTYISHS